MSRIAAAFDQAAGAGRLALIPYLTAGDPGPSRTVDLVLALEGWGADLVELGVPFSDPLADGEINQRAAARALRGGMTLAGVLEVCARIRKTSQVPLVLFTYFNPLLRMGLREFSARAREVGVDGVLVTDLPVEEGGEYRQALSEGGLEAVFLAAPTTQESRLRAIGEASSCFIYYVSRTGVTGERDSLSDDVQDNVERIRRLTGKKVAVGFGISSREQVTRLAAFADGVVVGSSLMRVVEESGDSEELLGKVGARFRELTDAEGLRPSFSPRSSA
jgi:tryptophan synthase alpha chain